MASFNEEFKNPGAALRAKPFWAWNGKLERGELLRQIDIMRDMGFGGFFMHSRTGLDTKYLGDEWFELINACADRAKELGLEAWLYDEDRWPSGTAGGEVTKNHDYRMHFLQMYVDGETPEQPIAAFAAKFDGEYLSSYRRVDSCDADNRNAVDDNDIADDEQLLTFGVVEMPESSFYNGETYLDTMNRDATEAFIESTHKKYVERCGDRIGDSILGIFTDEPHRGSLMSSFGQGVGSGERQIPWTKKLPDEFKKRYGYDLIDHLPEIFCRYDDKPAAIKWQYVELCEELFLGNFLSPIDEWCRAHNMILTGHVLHEDTLTAQVAMNGSMMRSYAVMQYPGIDFLGQHGRVYWIAKQLQSVSRQLGKTTLLSELDGCTGWQMSLEDYKSIGDWQALYGINLRCPHLSWYTMRGQAKRDYPASILGQSPWWREYSFLEDYYARIARFEADGKADCRLLVLHPIESVWARIHVGWCDGLGAREAGVARLEEHFTKLFYMLAHNHIDFDYGDEGLMAEYARVEGGKLYVGDAVYDRVLVSGLDTVRGTTAKLLHDFAAAGGRLVVAGDAPGAVDCIAGAPEWCAETIDFDEAAIADTLSDCAYDIRYADGSCAAEIFCQAKKVGSELRMVLLNDNRGEGHKGVTVRVKANGEVVRYIPESGEAVRVKSERDGEYVKFTLDFEAKGLLLISIGGNAAATDSVDADLTVSESLSADTTTNERRVIGGGYEYELDEPNLCVLDYASVTIDGGGASEPMEILRCDRYVREKFGLPFRGGEMLQPWFIGQRELPVKGRVKLTFGFDVEVLPEQPIKLVMEEPERFETCINGERLEGLCDGFFWADSCYFAYEILPSQLKLGRNEVTIVTDYREDSNLEAMFLQGNFGVKLDGNRRRLVKLPEKLACGSIVSQGLPFYSGKVTYILPVGDVESGKLEVPAFAGSCVTVSGNGRSALIAWRPYTSDITGMVEGGKLRMTVVLTRRNTFGPLHCVPALCGSYGPGNFETGGRSFSDDYMLLDAGLMAEPAVIG